MMRPIRISFLMLVGFLPHHGLIAQDQFLYERSGNLTPGRLGWMEGTPQPLRS